MADVSREIRGAVDALERATRGVQSLYDCGVDARDAIYTARDARDELLEAIARELEAQLSAVQVHVSGQDILIARLREDEAALIEVRAALRTPGGRDVVLSARAVRSLADRRAKG